jgi:hypothetical protein
LLLFFNLASRCCKYSSTSVSNNKGIIGKLAKASANVNGKTQAFRYTEKTLLETIEELSKKLIFKYTVEQQFKKDLIIVIKK